MLCLCLCLCAQSLARAKARLSEYASRVIFVHGSFADLPKHLADHGFPSQVDGVLLDLGFNSSQLSDPRRGISFRVDGPLDMRFDQVCARVVAAGCGRALLFECGWDCGSRRAPSLLPTWSTSGPTRS